MKRSQFFIFIKFLKITKEKWKNIVCKFQTKNGKVLFFIKIFAKFCYREQ